MTFRSKEMIMLERVRIMVTEAPMPMPLAMVVVIARVEHMPRSWTSTGFWRSVRL